jgi:tRNA A37 threonylcarbamoyladenosine modification protein TsaB
MPSGPYTLAIEISNPSSGPRGEGPGLYRGPGVALGRLQPRADQANPAEMQHLGTELLRDPSRHDDDLMPAIDRLFVRLGARPAELGAVAVSIGPGGYTSLRIAVATAKMLAEATGATTIAVPSAGVAAWLLPPSLAPAVVCLASKGPAAYGVLLPAPEGHPWWSRVGPAGLAMATGPEAGEMLDAHLSAGRSWIAGSVPLGMITADHILALRPASLIADRYLPDAVRAAAARINAAIHEPVFAPASVLALAAGAPPVDPLALTPLYGREAEAVTQWRLRKG